MTETVSPTAEEGMPSLAHRRHEARHLVSTWYFDGLQAGSVSVGIHAGVDQAGVMRWAPRTERIGPLEGMASLVCSLVGWMGDPDLPETAVWPEPWPVREDAPEHVGYLVRTLGLTQRQYEGVCQLAEELVEEPEFKQAVDLVARALKIAPHIDSEGLAILREAAGFPEAAAA